MPHDVFISFSTIDKLSAEAVCHGFEAAGIRCFISSRDIPPGKDFGEAINDAIEQCQVMVLIFSMQANTSKYVIKEVTLAVSQELTIIPFRIENVKPTRAMKYHLSNANWLDAFDEPLNEHISILTERVLAMLGSTPMPPSPLAKKISKSNEETVQNNPAQGIAVVQDTRARLTLTTDPPGAAVYIDQQNTNLITPCEYILNLWNDTSTIIMLELKLPCYEDFGGEVTLHRGERLSHLAVLTDMRARLQLSTFPPNASVCIDGEDIGQVTPCEFVKELNGILECEVEVALALDNFEPNITRVILRRGEILPFSSTLNQTPQPGDILENPKDKAKMVWVPAGDFTMGNIDPDKDAYIDEKPQHIVYLDGYWIYQHHVTVAQFYQFCCETGWPMPAKPPWDWHDDHPVVNVSWEDATAYAKWAGGVLPTEAEWEKAARGTDLRPYPWGNTWDATKCSNNVSSNKPGKTMSVGSFPAGASPYGCLDMAGNVWQWCADRYGADYYKSSPTRNPTGPETGNTRVVRGGSWSIDSARHLRACSRYSSEPAKGWELLGFRCVLHTLEF